VGEVNRCTARLGVEEGDPCRVLVTLLFTDVVGSTRWAVKLGDRRWAELLDAHHAVVRELLSRHAGREVDAVGDGFLAAFDRAAEALRCAVAVVRSVRTLGLELRTGLHTGECELVGGSLRGVAVHAGARVKALAAPGEVLVSETVRHHAAGSGLRFRDRGTHELRGLPGRWRLFALAAEDGPARPATARTRRRRAAAVVRHVWTG
jgi:class 3 adenylate cyclase